VFSDLNIQSDKIKLQRVKIQFITTRVERGETSYDPSMLTKPAIHQDCASREHERERDKTHSYWYKPSAPRVDYAPLIVVAAGMMKMATGDDSPLRQGARMGSRLVYRGYRALRWRNF